MGKVLFEILSILRRKLWSHLKANFRKVPSPCWILMKFAGNISFINSMILSKFQVDCMTLADFRIFTYIGIIQGNSIFGSAIIEVHHLNFAQILSFLPFLVSWYHISLKKWEQICFENMTFIPPTTTMCLKILEIF